MGRAWVFQANPDIWDVDAAVRNSAELRWLVRQYHRQISRGDRVYMWRSGPDGGVVAIAKTISDPELLPPDDVTLRYAREDAKFEDAQLRVELELTGVLERTLTKDELRADARTSRLSVLERPQGTNFPVEPEEAE